MNRVVAAVLFSLLMIPAPVVSNHADESGITGPPSLGDDYVSTDYPAVNSAIEDATATTNEGLRVLYDSLEPTTRPVGSPQSAITLFQDGVMSDPHYGAIGAWNTTGDWGPHEEALRAHTGDWSFAIGDVAGYPTDVTRALVTPELDLRTGYSISGVANPVPDVTVPRDQVDDTVEDLLPVTEDEAADLVEDTLDLDDEADSVRPYEAIGTATNDPQFVLRYWARHNLGMGVDGLQVWVFDHEPEASELVTCITASGCTVVTPQPLAEVPPRLDTTQAFGTQLAYEGTADWGQHYVDLTPWAEERVHVAYVFRAERNLRGDAYFNDPEVFGRSDYYGFALDDIELRGLAATSNLQVHELLAPLPPATGTFRFDEGASIPVKTVVRNTGSVTVQAHITTEITGPGVEATDYTKETIVELRPGESQNIDIAFPAFGEPMNNLRASVSAEIVPNSDPTTTFYLPVVDPLVGLVNEQLPSAAQIPYPGELVGPVLQTVVPADVPVVTGEEPLLASIRDGLQTIVVPITPPTPRDINGADDAATSATFKVDSTRGLTLTQPVLSKSWVDRNDPFTVSTTVTNIGTNPETTALVPYLANMDDHCADASDRILKGAVFGDVVRTLQLQPGQSVTETWHIDTSQIGRYRFFIGTKDTEPFSPLSCAPITKPVLDSTYVGSAPILDGKQDALWANVPPQTLVFDESKTAQVRLANTDSGLYMLLVVPDSTEDLEADKHDDVISLFFDDFGDGRIKGGDDAVRIGPNETGQPLFADLAYDAVAKEWTPGDLLGAANRTYDAATGTYTIEVHRPLGPDGALKTRAGQYLGLSSVLATEYRNSNDQVTFNGSWVHPAGLDDGPEDAPDWTLVHLKRNPTIDLVGQQVRSGGFGIGTGPPTIAQFNFQDDCAATTGPDWSTNGGATVRYPYSGAGTTPVVGQDTWTCGFYAPEGQNLWYAGLRANPGALCGGMTCLPYANAGTDTGAQPESILTFRPGSIEGDDPYLLLRHQYATPVTFSDDTDGIDQDGWGGSFDGKDLGVEAIAYVTAHTPTRNYVLTPGLKSDDTTRHYDTEETVEIKDRRHPNGRIFSDTGFSGNRAYCNTIGTPRDCGWWHPVGDQIGYLPPDERFPLGGTFEGSPWKVDRIPLTGEHWQTLDGHGTRSASQGNIDLRNEPNLELRFHYVRHSHGTFSIDPNNDPEYPYGWRIAALAITEGPGGVRDLSVTDARLDLPYDADKLGLGPGGNVNVAIDVANTGVLTVGNVLVHADCYDATDPSATTPIATGSTLLPDPIDPGSTIKTHAACKLPANSEGMRIRVEARVTTAGVGDDLRINDVRKLPGVYRVEKSPDLAVEVEVRPDSGSKEQGRFVDINLVNKGNVQVTQFNALLQFKRGEELILARPTWPISTAIPVGESVRLTPSTAAALGIDVRDLRFDQLTSGEYSANVTVTLSNDKEPANNVATGVFRVVTNLYSDDFTGRPEFEFPGLILGSGSGGDAWKISTWQGTTAARAGDGDLPAHTDASLTLPTIDLTSANGATLSLKHAYDLERGYDAARVEATTDGGTTWKIVRPRPTTHTPLGYPDERLVGSNPLLDGLPESRATTFTGSSKDHPLAENGYITTEFRLGDIPSLQADQRFADFPLTELNPTSTASFTDPRDGRDYFFDESWAAPGGDMGWLVESATRNDPRPHSGEQMWWSGTPGAWMPDHRFQVTTELSFPLDLRPTATNPVPANHSVSLDFWDWRAGWQDDELDHQREGTGGDFVVQVVTSAGTTEQIVATIGAEEDGWTHREVDLTAYVGQAVTLTFRYAADPENNNGAAPYKQTRRDYNTKLENNRGWFLDDLHVEHYLRTTGERANIGVLLDDNLEDPNLTPTDDKDCEPTGIYSRTSITGSSARESRDCWQLRRHATDESAAWHIGMTPGPSGRDVRAWRIADDSEQGYPHMVDALLVTPPVDLRSVVGTSAALTFDHRYQLEADQTYNQMRAIDGGVVEVQVFNTTTGTYDPWHQLVDSPPGTIIVDASISPATYPARVLAQDDDPRALSGYPALYLRGDMGQTSSTFYDSGIGAPFQPFDGYCRACVGIRARETFSEHPVGYAFSGDSGGWQEARFDISPYLGQKVRFAFHAWTNPSDALESNRPTPLTGWDITDVAVSGVVFEGKPTQLRFRVGTDDSILAGQWNITALEVSGDILEQNLAIQTDDTTLRFPTSTSPTWTVDVTNLGRAARTTVALGVRAFTVNGSVLDVVLTNPAGEAIPAADVRNLLDHESVQGGIDLTPVGRPGSSSTWTIRVPNAPANEDILVQARILEDNGRTSVVNGVFQHTTSYTPPREPVLANTRTTWDVRVEDREELRLGSLAGDMDLRIDGAGPGSDGDVVVSGVLFNDGTLDVARQLTWTLESLDGTVLRSDDATVLVAPAESQVGFSWPLEDLATGPNGLYRVTVSVADGPSASVEFPVGTSENVFVERFDTDPGWTVSNNTNDPGSDTLQWSTSIEPGFLAWGVHPFSGEGYCEAPKHLRCDTGGGDGFEWTVTTDPISLHRSLNDRAVLTLDHTFFFFYDLQRRGDGGRLEVAVLDAQGQPVGCDGGSAQTDSWMPLAPTGGTLHDGTTLSDNLGGARRGNPLGMGTQVFSGPQGSIYQPVRSTYDLSDLLWCVGGNQETLLRDHDVQLRLHVGVTEANANFHRNRPGWQVDELGITSGGVTLGPVDGNARTIAMDRNAPKRIAYTVQNSGIVENDFRLSLEFLDAAPPKWLSLEQDTIHLEGGESKLVWVSIQTPESLPAGRHAMRLVAESFHPNDDIQDVLTTFLDVAPLPKADLSATLFLESTDFQQGSVATLPVRIENVGTLPSGKTIVRFEVEHEDGTVVPIETLPVSEVCAPVDCGPVQSKTIVPAEWSVPETPGAYILRAIIDPENRLLDFDASNNVDEVLVNVVPLQLPDLSVQSIQVTRADGVTPIDGRFVDDGSVVTVRATLRNDGHVASQGATARILAGTVTLTEAKLPLIAPGATYVVETIKVVQAGASGVLDLRAIVTGGQLTELRVDNNELLRSLSVRTHDVHLVVRDDLAARAGGATTVPVQVRNDGNALEQLTLEASGPTGWKLRVLTPTVIVPPGATLTGLLLVEVPDGTAAGRHLLPVVARAEERAVAQTSAPVTVASILEAATIDLALGDVPSGDGVLPLGLSSRSNADQVLRIVDALGWIDVAEVGLGAFEDKSLDLPLRIPSNTPPGQYADILTIAPLDGTWEIVLHHTWTVLPTLDVHAAWVAEDALDTPGNGTRAMRLELDMLSHANVPMTLDLRANTTEGTHVARPATAYLEPLEQRRFSLVVYVDERLATPQGVLLVQMDAGPERRILELPLPDLSTLPDLMIPALVSDAIAPKVGEPLLVRGVLRNDGNAPSTPSTLHAYAAGVLVATVDVPALPAGTETGFNFTWAPRSGNQDLVVLADGARDVLELHEDNNGATTRILVDEPLLTGDLLRGVPAPSAATLLLAMVLAVLLLRRRRA